MTSHAQAAKSIKAELAKKFPGIVFSVRSKSFAGGSDVSVNWTNGPTSSEVNAIIDKYQYGDFDGMQDLYELRRNRPETNGSAKYIFGNRHIDPAGYTAMVKDLCRLSGVEYNPEEWIINVGQDTATHIINQVMENRPVPSGASIVGLERTECTCGRIGEFYRPVFSGEEVPIVNETIKWIPEN